MFRSKTLKTILYCTAIYEAHRFHTSYDILEKYVYLPISRNLPGEISHKMALRAIKWNIPPCDRFKDDALKTKVFGMELENPIGLAAGFDKDGEAIRGCRRLGFGFIEAGSVTPEPQDGNEKPRVFKLPEDEGIINRYGFPSQGHMMFIKNMIQSQQQPINFCCTLVVRKEVGQDEISQGLNNLESMGFDRKNISVLSLSEQANRIMKNKSLKFDDQDDQKIKSLFQIIVGGHPVYECTFQPVRQNNISEPTSKIIKFFPLIVQSIAQFKPNDCTLGINLGVNKKSLDPLNDYIQGVNCLWEFADYMVINVSSPNTPGLRQLQNRDKLERILGHVSAHMKRIKNMTTDNFCPPLLLKISPDLSDEQLMEIIELVEDPKFCVDGLIVSNTTISRPSTLINENKVEKGGLSGKPLKDLSTEMIRKVYRLSGGRVKIVGVGGIQNAEDAYEKIRAGASVVQLYSGIVYNGLGSVRKMKKDLVQLLKRDGFTNIEQVVGVDNEISESLKSDYI